MKASIVTTFIGCFGIGEDDKIVVYVKFPKDPKRIAEKMQASEREMIPEEEEVERELRKGGFTDITKSDNEFVRSNLRQLAVERKFVKDQIELNRLISDVNVELAKVSIKKAMGRDALVIQVNGAMEELDKSINILAERLREWYGLHFPEMGRIIESHEKFAELVEKFGSRKKVEHPELSHFKEKSMGMDLGTTDARVIQDFAKYLLGLYKLREELSKYSEQLLRETAPNLTELAGPALASKLVSLAGGLERLARMPSSTIQLLGAEKALFRHLHGRGKSPKHGIIVMHPYIQKAPLELRGKIARLMSSKLSMAAKIDFYSKTDKGKEMKKELEAKIKEVLKPK